MHEPQMVHWRGALHLHVLAYIKGAPGKGLISKTWTQAMQKTKETKNQLQAIIPMSRQIWLPREIKNKM